MSDVRSAGPTPVPAAPNYFEYTPSSEWADWLLMSLTVEPRHDRPVFAGSRGALAARLDVSSNSRE